MAAAKHERKRNADKAAKKKPVAKKQQTLNTAGDAQEKPAAKAKKLGKPAAKHGKKGDQPGASEQIPVSAAPAEKSAKAGKEKPKKAKLVRDSFTMPENEYQAIADIKKACIGAGFEIKKSELLRIGVALLQQMTPAQIQEALSGLPALKAGRPKKSEGDSPAVQ